MSSNQRSLRQRAERQQTSPEQRIQETGQRVAYFQQQEQRSPQAQPRPDAPSVDEQKADFADDISQEFGVSLSLSEVIVQDGQLALTPQARRRVEAVRLGEQTGEPVQPSQVILEDGQSRLTETAEREFAAEDFSEDLGMDIAPSQIIEEGDQLTVSDSVFDVEPISDPQIGRQELPDQIVAQTAAEDLEANLREQISENVTGETGFAPSGFDLTRTDVEQTDTGWTLSEQGEQDVQQATQQVQERALTSASVPLSEELQQAQQGQRETAAEQIEQQIQAQGFDIDVPESQVTRQGDGFGPGRVLQERLKQAQQEDAQQERREAAAEQIEGQIQDLGFDLTVPESQLIRDEGGFAPGRILQERLTQARAESSEDLQIQPGSGQLIASDEAIAEQVETQVTSEIVGGVGGNDPAGITEFAPVDVTAADIGAYGNLTDQARREIAAEQFQAQLETDLDVDPTAVELTDDGARLEAGFQDALGWEQEIERRQREFEERQQQVETAQSLEGIQGVDARTELGTGEQTSERLAREEQLETDIEAASGLTQDDFNIVRGEFIPSEGLQQQREQQQTLERLGETQGVDVSTEFLAGQTGGFMSAERAQAEMLEDRFGDIQGVDPEAEFQSGTAFGLGAPELARERISRRAAADYSEAFGYEVTPNLVRVEETPRGRVETSLREDVSDEELQPSRESASGGGDIFSGAVDFAEDTTGLDVPGEGSIANVAAVEERFQPSGLTGTIPGAEGAAATLSDWGQGFDEQIVQPTADVAAYTQQSTPLGYSLRMPDVLGEVSEGDVRGATEALLPTQTVDRGTRSLEEFRTGDDIFDAEGFRALSGRAEGQQQTTAETFTTSTARGVGEIANLPAWGAFGITAADVAATGAVRTAQGEGGEFAAELGGAGTLLAARFTEQSAENPVQTAGMLAGSSAASVYTTPIRVSRFDVPRTEGTTTTALPRISRPTVNVDLPGVDSGVRARTPTVEADISTARVTEGVAGDAPNVEVEMPDTGGVSIGRPSVDLSQAGVDVTPPGLTRPEATPTRGIRLTTPRALEGVVDVPDRTLVGFRGARPTLGAPEFDLDTVDLWQLGSRTGAREAVGEFETDVLSASARQTGGDVEARDRVIGGLASAAARRRTGGTLDVTTEELVSQARDVPDEAAWDIAETLEDLDATVKGSASTAAQIDEFRTPRDLDVVVENPARARAKLGGALEGTGRDVGDVFDIATQDEFAQVGDVVKRGERVGERPTTQPTVTGVSPEKLSDASTRAGELRATGELDIEPGEQTRFEFEGEEFIATAEADGVRVRASPRRSEQEGVTVTSVEEELIRKTGAAGFFRAPDVPGEGFVGTRGEVDVGPEPNPPFTVDQPEGEQPRFKDPADAFQIGEQLIGGELEETSIFRPFRRRRLQREQEQVEEFGRLFSEEIEAEPLDRGIDIPEEATDVTPPERFDFGLTGERAMAGGRDTGRTPDDPDTDMSRREFLQRTGTAAAGASLFGDIDFGINIGNILRRGDEPAGQHLRAEMAEDELFEGAEVTPLMVRGELSLDSAEVNMSQQEFRDLIQQEIEYGTYEMDVLRQAVEQGMYGAGDIFGDTRRVDTDDQVGLDEDPMPTGDEPPARVGEDTQATRTVDDDPMSDRVGGASPRVSERGTFGTSDTEIDTPRSRARSPSQPGGRPEADAPGGFVFSPEFGISEDSPGTTARTDSFGVVTGTTPGATAENIFNEGGADTLSRVWTDSEITQGGGRLPSPSSMRDSTTAPSPTGSDQPSPTPRDEPEGITSPTFGVGEVTPFTNVFETDVPSPEVPGPDDTPTPTFDYGWVPTPTDRIPSPDPMTRVPFESYPTGEYEGVPFGTDPDQRPRVAGERDPDEEGIQTFGVDPAGERYQNPVASGSQFLFGGSFGDSVGGESQAGTLLPVNERGNTEPLTEMGQQALEGDGNPFGL